MAVAKKKTKAKRRKPTIYDKIVELIAELDEKIIKLQSRVDFLENVVRHLQPRQEPDPYRKPYSPFEPWTLPKPPKPKFTLR